MEKSIKNFRGFRKYFKKGIMTLVIAGAAISLGACAGGNGGASDSGLSADTPWNFTTTAQPNAFINQIEHLPIGFAELNHEEILEMLWGDISPYHIPGSLDNQLALPDNGEYFAIMRTNYGDIFIRLFPELAPLAVQNFVGHAIDGYYDGVIFHRIIENFMIQGGDPMGTGMGGTSIWDGQFGTEASPNLRHVRGALSMANTGQPMSSGSQFFIVQNNSVSSHDIDMLNSWLQDQDDEVLPAEGDEPAVYLRDLWPPDVINHYLAHGGTPHLDFQHTVFGQVFYGMDVVDNIAAAPTGAADRPIDDIYIEEIIIARFEG